jgi:death on curing protein
MTTIEMVDEDMLLAMHDEQLAEHGGAPGLRDENLMRSALARPEMKLQYGVDDVRELAAALAYGVARNHPFIDGNKRTAYVAMETLLGMNGWRLVATDEDATVTFLRLAAGEVPEHDLSDWIKANSIPLVTGRGA